MKYGSDLNRAAVELINKYGATAELYADDQFERYTELGDEKKANWWLQVMQVIELVLDAQGQVLH